MHANEVFQLFKQVWALARIVFPDGYHIRAITTPIARIDANW